MRRKVLHFNPAAKQYCITELRHEIDRVLRWVDIEARQAVRIAALQQNGYKEVDIWTFRRNL